MAGSGGEDGRAGAAEEPRLPLDLARLARWMAARGLPRPIAARQFSGGQSNPTYRLETVAGPLVLRRKPPGPLLPKAHMIEREYAVMEALGRTGFPVPRTRALCEDTGVIGAVFYVMDHVEGRVLHDPRLPGLARRERRAIHEALIDRLAELHRIDPAAAGLAGFGRPGGFLARQVRIWTAQHQASATAPIAEMDRLAGWLADAVERVPDETALVHGDYRLDNVVLAPDRPEVAAVLDWELSTLGHPLADLAHYLMTWTFPDGLRYGLGEADLDGLGIPSLAALAARYAAAAGRDGLPELELLLAFATWRMAAILSGVHARGLAGNAADPAALAMGADVPRLAAIAWEHARRAGA